MSVEKVIVDGVPYEVAPLAPPVADTPQSHYWAITREVADSWLRYNNSNRNHRRRASSAYSRDVLSANWDVNGETLKISRPLREGEIEDMLPGHVLYIDGQHRLEAVRRSGNPIVSLVAYGLDPATRRSVDAGILRNVGDVLKMNGETNASPLASVLRLAYLWDNEDYRLSGNSRPTRAECEILLNRNGSLLRRAAEKAVYVRAKFKALPPSITALAYYILCPIDEGQAAEFFERLRDGAGLAGDHPILTLRNQLINEKMEKRSTPKHQQIAYIIRSWNAVREDRPLQRLSVSADDPMPMPK